VTHSGSVPTFPEPFLAATEKGAPPIQISGAQLSFTEHKTVTKADLAGAIHAETGLSKKASVDFVDSILGKIEAALIAGDNVKLSGFGNFCILNKSDRIGRNPKTGQSVTIEARRIVTFRASPRFSDRVTQAFRKRSENRSRESVSQ